MILYLHKMYPPPLPPPPPHPPPPLPSSSSSFLLLFGQRHELDRFSAWQNPSGATELNVPGNSPSLPPSLPPSSSITISSASGEDGVVSWQNPTQSDRHWQSTVIMANQASPHLAFQLVHR